MNDLGSYAVLAFFALLPALLILWDLYKTFYPKRKLKDPKVTYMSDHNHRRRRRTKKR